MGLVPEVEGETAQSFSDVPLLSDLYVLGKQKQTNNRPNTAIDRCKTYPNKYTLPILSSLIECYGAPQSRFTFSILHGRPCRTWPTPFSHVVSGVITIRHYCEKNYRHIYTVHVM